MSSSDDESDTKIKSSGKKREREETPPGSVELDDIQAEENKQEEKSKKQKKENEIALVNIPHQLVSVINKLVPIQDEDLWRQLSNATETDGIIHFDPDEFFDVTRSIKRKSLLVRDSYRKLHVLMTDKNIFNEQTNKVLVTGTPGIGKSAFGIYLLYKLVQERKLSHSSLSDDLKRPLLIQRRTDELIWITTAGTFIVRAATEDYRLYLSLIFNKAAIMIADLKAEVEPDESRATTIILCSPNPARYKDFLKSKTHAFVLNPWDDEELEKLRKESYANEVDEVLFKNLLHIYGGVPRFVLEKAGQSASNMEHVIHKNDNEFVNIVKSVNKSGAPDILSNMILHLTSSDLSYEKKLYKIASEYVSHRLCKIYRENKDDELKDFIANTRNNKFQSTRGWLFEMFSFPEILQNGIAGFIPLNEGMKKIVREVNKSYIHANLSELVAPKNSISYSSGTDLSYIARNILYIPEKCNEASLDSFLITSDNRVLVFQMTVAAKYGVKISGLNKVIQIVKNQKNQGDIDFKFYLVFVVDADAIKKRQPLEQQVEYVINEGKTGYKHNTVTDYSTLSAELQQLAINQFRAVLVNMQRVYLLLKR